MKLKFLILTDAECLKFGPFKVFDVFFKNLIFFCKKSVFLSFEV